MKLKIKDRIEAVLENFWKCKIFSACVLPSSLVGAPDWLRPIDAAQESCTALAAVNGLKRQNVSQHPRQEKAKLQLRRPLSLLTV
jgi:hypothetical protein